ncbi:ABC-type multidrug transport system, ATPase and permease component [Glycomyces sambucus]|uniref:ABC-type multidrug transport system, ATPase and permease component n=1 Tax=Glycomyces sambucus TaxID=380244 RepID=A0A1G9HSJ3_9ACTN|nr:ABC transporter ATP-binding protein [Glycomyces sambucus]SDL15928.1 ABC-type multidrug transport system, ATPase and permease component [Glycomyces sambucus]
MPSEPRPLTPARLLLRQARPNRWRLVLGLLCYAGASCASMPQLWIIGKIIDEGFIGRSARDFAVWLALAAALVVIQPILWANGFRQFSTVEARNQRALVRDLTDRLNSSGAAVGARVSAGELLNLPSEDARRAARAVSDAGFFFNTLVMFAVGAALVWSIHPLLGIVIISGSMVTAVIAGPLLGRLQSRQSDYRARIGDLSAHAADIVGGLRVLRGIGGDVLFAARYRERSTGLRRKGYEVAGPSSWIHALRHSMPIVFVAVITWAGSLLAAGGEITIGGLASAFSFATIFIAISGNFIGCSQYLVAAWVAAKRIVRVLRIEPDLADDGTATGGGGELRDPESGLAVPVAGLTVVVTAETAPAAAACERLARYRDSEAEWGDRPLRAYTLKEVRSRIMLLTDEDYLFTGTLAETMRVPEAEARAAIAAACADDVASQGMDLRIDEGGRNLSGGQRQRLRLARALAAEPETLLAVEPTSAVDAHTESLIAARVAAARAGRATLVVTASPLWLAHADLAVWLVDGKVRAAGTHAELLADAAYRRLASHSVD